MDPESVPTEPTATVPPRPEPWRVELVVTADQSGAGFGAAHGAADAGSVARLPEPKAHEYGAAWEYRELARVSDATLTVAFVAGGCWEGTGRAAIDAAVSARKPATHLEVDSDWQPEDVPDAFVQVVADWLARHRVRVLHVCGPSEKNSPGIGAITRALVGMAIERAARVVDEEPETLSGVTLANPTPLTEETLIAAADAISRSVEKASVLVDELHFHPPRYFDMDDAGRLIERDGPAPVDPNAPTVTVTAVDVEAGTVTCEFNGHNRKVDE